MVIKKKINKKEISYENAKFLFHQVEMQVKAKFNFDASFEFLPRIVVPVFCDVV